jgi:DNA-binding IclR family transcriptional regulator
VREARARGWSHSSGELLEGTTGVGAPILAGDGPAQAAISAVWLAPRDVEAAGEMVLESARAISAELG